MPVRLHHEPGRRDRKGMGRDRHFRFHLHDQLEPAPDIGGLLRETGRDLIAIFRG